MNLWQDYADKLSDKLMDVGNLTFGALIVGQLIRGTPFNWWVAALGLIVWLWFYILGYLAVQSKGRGE